MALSEYRRGICRLIAANCRASGESYVAGGVALNTLLNTSWRERAGAIRDGSAEDCMQVSYPLGCLDRETDFSQEGPEIWLNTANTLKVLESEFFR